MNNPRYQYKQEAKDLLAGKYEKPLIVLLVFFVFNAIIGSIVTKLGPKYSTTFPIEVIEQGNPAMVTIFNIVGFIIGAAIVYATIKLALNIASKKEFTVEEVILCGFKENFIRNVFLQFMVSLFTFLWMLLLIIPGIIKAYAYSMSFYLVNKETDLDAMAAIEKSKNYTRGYKATGKYVKR